MGYVSTHVHVAEGEMVRLTPKPGGPWTAPVRSFCGPVPRPGEERTRLTEPVINTGDDQSPAIFPAAAAALATTSINVRPPRLAQRPARA
jgi:hypothetical protein